MAWEDLARAVLLQAAYDALADTNGKKHKNPSQQDKRDAIRFLQGKRPFRERLEMFCMMCGVESTAVMKIMRDEELLKKGLTFPKISATLANVDETERSQNDRNPNN